MTTLSRAPLYMAAVLLCGLPDAGWACRCAPQPLARYIADAELVFLGRAEAVRTSDGAAGQRAVEFAVQGKPYKGDPAALASFATPLSSATCGYAVERGGLYLVFASRHAPGERVAWFDTCNGTRDFDPKAPGGATAGTASGWRMGATGGCGRRTPERFTRCRRCWSGA